ncbi:MAG: pyrroline-5-carboxylate reductase [bacterium]|nr:pyrroline-5-carboxylate reductase [bacterium]
MTTKLGFIGFGKMAEALWSGFITYGNVTECLAVDTNVSRLRMANEMGVKSVSVADVVAGSDLIFVCVKPQHLADLLGGLGSCSWEGKTVVSIVAGKASSVFTHYLGEKVPVIRVMPNTPALLGEGMTAFCVNTFVSDKIKQVVSDLFECVGRVIEVNESQMHVVTGISGSGPAYFYKIAREIMPIATDADLSPDQAITLIAQTLRGAGQMLMDSGKDPETLILDVSSPGGTTVAGLTEFDRQGLGSAFRDVVNAAVARSQELT